MTARRLWPILTSAGAQGLPPAPAKDKLPASANHETIISAVLDIICLARRLQFGCTPSRCGSSLFVPCTVLAEAASLDTSNLPSQAPSPGVRVSSW
jgi:hypothetical protein